MTRSTAGTSWSGRGSWCAPIAARPASTRQTIADVEEYGVARLLDELAADLRDGQLPAASGPPGVHPEARQADGAKAAVDSCCPRPRRSGRREDRDRADLRGGLSAVLVRVPARGDRQHDALQVLIDESWRGRRWVAESDIANCFEAIPHSGLMSAVEERICDRHVLKLLRAMLRAGVMEDGRGPARRDRYPAGRGDLARACATSTCTGWTGQWQTRGHGVLVRYADDLLVMCQDQAGGRGRPGGADGRSWPRWDSSSNRPRRGSCT